MKKAIKIGLLIYIFIECCYWMGVTHKTTDEDYILPTMIDTTPFPKDDTARHYKQRTDLTPNLGKHVIDVNTD